jgi:uncharacterized Tic20 family protein
MKKYVLVFSASYLALAVVLGVVAELLKFKASAGLGVVPILGASFIAAWIFSKDHAREPTPQEKKSFTWQALLSFWVVSLVMSLLLILFLSPNERAALLGIAATKTFLLIFLGSAVFLSAIFFFAIRWSFAWYAKLALSNRREA